MVGVEGGIMLCPYFLLYYVPHNPGIEEASEATRSGKACSALNSPRCQFSD